MTFFETKEYITLIKIRDRLRILNTENNREIYAQYLKKCRLLANDSYKNIGWREDTETYAWESFDDIGPPMIHLGDYQSGASFMPGWNIYMAEDYSAMILKNDKGDCVFYNQNELKHIESLPTNEIQKIHKIKMMFEGEINGCQKGNNFSKGDTGVFERFR